MEQLLLLKMKINLTHSFAELFLTLCPEVWKLYFSTWNSHTEPLFGCCVFLKYDNQHLAIRNSLDVMHCEKNFAENISKTITRFKDKDSVKVRRDIQREGIRPPLWMTRNPSNPLRMLKTAANYVLTAREFDILCSRLQNLKVPSGY